MLPLGESPCFVSLAKILGENPSLKRKVTYRIHEFRARAKSLRDVKNPRHRAAMLVLLRDSFLRDLAETGWPRDVWSHTANCITVIYREELKGADTRAWGQARREQSRLAGS